MIPELAKHTEKLYYFYEIANSGSLHACARKLGLSAPTLSYAIKQLEHISGVELFTRHKKGMTVTKAGETLLAFCRKLYRDLETIEDQIHRDSEQQVTKVNIGTFQSIAIYFWPYLLESIKDDSSLSISLMTNRSSSVIESLLKREIDLALTVEAPLQAGLISHELYTDQYALYGSTKLKLESLTQEEARKLTLIYIPSAIDRDGVSLRQHINSWGYNFHEEFNVDSFEVVGEFVSKNYAVGILPNMVARNYKKKITPLKLTNKRSPYFGDHRFFLSYRNDLDLPQRLMDLFLDSAVNAVQKLVN